MGQTPKTSGNAQNKEESAAQNSYSRNALRKRNGDAHLHKAFGLRHHHRRGLGPLGNRPEEDGGEGVHPGCGRTPLLPLEPMLLWWLHASMPWWFRLISLFSMPNRPSFTIKAWVVLSSKTHFILEPHLTHILYSSS
jgi:hypothetical protein